MKHFLSIQDVPDLNDLVGKALRYKSDPYIDKTAGHNKRIGLLFFNPSMRTRLSTQIAARNLGLDSIVLNVGQEGWTLEFGDDTIMNGTTVEHIRDAAPVLGKYFDLLGVRTFPALQNKEEDYSENYLNQFVRHAGVPIVSLESATLHPLQSLADIITLHEAMPRGRKPKIVLTWAPHIKALPQCVANSFSQWVNAWNEADFYITHPPGFALDESFSKGATITTDQDQALEGADFVYVKTWSSVANYGKIPEPLPNWMLTAKKVGGTNRAKVMHCLPVRRNVELASEILDGPHSLVTEQAANRVWAAQAVLRELLRNG